MSRIASVKETGEELSQAEWKRFEEAVAKEVKDRPDGEPDAGHVMAREQSGLEMKPIAGKPAA